nr:hypothetical protein [Tanacetum cinerariifolium]
MRTRSSSNLPVVSSNPSTSNPKHRNRRRSKQHFILEESPVDTMADQRNMEKLLRAPTEGYVEAIVVPSILAEQFQLKHSLINMMTTDQFFGLEKNNPHDYIRWGSLLVAKKRTPKDLLRACPHHGFTELHQLDTFYNALNPADQDSLNAAAGGNLLERRTQDVLMIIENKSKVCISRNKAVVSQVKSCDASSNSSSEIAKLTYAINQQTSVVTTAMTAILKQFQATPPPASVKAIEETCVTCGGAHLYYQCLVAGGNTFQNFGIISNDTFHGLVLDGPTVPTPRPFINPEEDERVEETLTDPDLSEYTIKVPPPLVQKYKPLSQRKYVVHQRDPLHLNIPYPSSMLKQKQQEKDEVQIHKFWQMFKQLHVNITLADALILMPKYQKMIKALLSNKEKLQELANTPLNENCSTVILKKLPEKLGDPGKFLIPSGFIGIARDVFVLVGKFTFPADFVIVDYKSDPRVPLILGRPFLRTARALIDVHGEEMILRDDLHPPLHVNPLSGSTTYSSSPNPLLEELADELALITFPPK